MKREIKFRAWDTVQEKMLPVETINFREDLITLDEGDNSVSDSNEMFILVQYTGLKDRNGKEIYEGDIMKIPDLYETPENTEMTYHNRVIDFAHGGFRLGGFHVTEDYEYIQEECEVIGNRWDNPDLLEGGYE